MSSLIHFAIFVFAGGDASDVSQLLQRTFSEPVAIQVHDLALHRSFEAEYSEVDELRQELGTRLRLKWVKHKWAGHEGTLPPYMLQASGALAGDPKQSYLRKAKAKTLSKSNFDSGMISFSTEKGKLLPIATLSRAPFSKPVSVHWLYYDLGVAVSSSKVSEESFLSLLAQAVGAKFEQSSESYRFTFDAAEFRARALASLDGKSPTGDLRLAEYQEADRNLLRETLKAASDEELATAFATPASECRLDMKNHLGLQRAAQRRLEAIAALSKVEDLKLAGYIQPRLEMLERCDLSRPVQVHLNARFQVSLDVWDRTNPTAIIRF